VETGLTIASGRVSKSPQSRFVLVPVGDYFLVALVPMRQLQGGIDGHLTIWSSPMTVEGGGLTEVRKKFPQHKLLPFQLDASQPGQPSLMLLGTTFLVGFGFIFGLSGVALYRAPQKVPEAPAVADPFKHPVWQLKR